MRGLWYFFLSVLTQVSCHVIGLSGHNVTLPCKYDTQTYGVLSFCWGRGKVPQSKCSNTILSSNDGTVDFRRSPRYQLLGRLTEGDVSLTILNAELSDAGVYGCRVEIPGWFNDHKLNTQLVVDEASEEKPVTEEWILTTAEAQEILAPSTSTNTEAGDPKLARIVIATTEEEFKAFLGLGNISRVAAIFLLSIIIILVSVFRRGFLPRRTLEHLSAPAAENIYESIPCSV